MWECVSQRWHNLVHELGNQFVCTLHQAGNCGNVSVRDGTTWCMSWETSLCAPCTKQGIAGMCQSKMAQEAWTVCVHPAPSRELRNVSVRDGTRGLDFG